MTGTDLHCPRCQEKIGTIKTDMGYFSRPYKVSACKRYRSKMAYLVCSSPWGCETPELALQQFPMTAPSRGGREKC